jgi:protein-tyrosine phosphatase
VDPNHQWAIDRSDEAAMRNRYFNIQPWRNNSVKLKVPDGCCDYINASPIVLQDTLTGRKKDYIVTQGPQEGQFNHFWRMVWEESNVKKDGPVVIVMLTQTQEAGRNKCYQYFPLEQGDTMSVNDEDEFGDGFSAVISVEEFSTDFDAHTDVRKFKLKVGEEEKTVFHLLFLGWPDFQVPEGDGRHALLRLINLSKKLNGISTENPYVPGQEIAVSNPRIVHCSAGVGRSGTFIALEYLLEELWEGALSENDPTKPKDNASEPANVPSVTSTDPPSVVVKSTVVHPAPAQSRDVIFDLVNNLRKQRMSMVQSEMQLDFIYKILKEHWSERGKWKVPEQFLLET